MPISATDVPSEVHVLGYRGDAGFLFCVDPESAFARLLNESREPLEWVQVQGDFSAAKVLAPIVGHLLSEPDLSRIRVKVKYLGEIEARIQASPSSKKVPVVIYEHHPNFWCLNDESLSLLEERGLRPEHLPSPTNPRQLLLGESENLRHRLVLALLGQRIAPFVEATIVRGALPTQSLLFVQKEEDSYEIDKDDFERLNADLASMNVARTVPLAFKATPEEMKDPRQVLGKLCGLGETVFRFVTLGLVGPEGHPQRSWNLPPPKLKPVVKTFDSIVLGDPPNPDYILPNRPVQDMDAELQACLGPQDQKVVAEVKKSLISEGLWPKTQPPRTRHRKTKP